MRPATELAAPLGGRSSLAVVLHDEPDPDCLASAAALAAIARRCGVRTVEYVDGDRLSRPQNRALARYLGVDVRPVTGRAPEADVVALVDHAIPGQHDVLPPDAPVDVVVDHHEYDRPVIADFVDVRPTYGATATLLFEYLRDLDVPISTPLASALLFALHRERLDRVRHPTYHEYEAALALFPLADLSVIDRFYRSGVTTTTADAVAAAIRNRRVHDSCLVSWTGPLPQREAIPQAADYLLTLQPVDSVLVLGTVDGEVHFSARSIDPRVDLARLLPRVVGTDARAGGHSDMAGGVVPPSAFDAPMDDRRAADVVGTRFCAAIESVVGGGPAPNSPASSPPSST